MLKSATYPYNTINGKDFLIRNFGLIFAFNGKEMDNETYGSENEYDYGDRIYSPRLGRWLSLDDLMKKYPYLSAYAFVQNSPILYRDKDGRDLWLGGDREKALDDIKSIIPASAHSALSMADDGKISFDVSKLTAKALNDPGVKLLISLVGSPCKYKYEVTDVYKAISRNGEKVQEKTFTEKEFEADSRNSIDNLSKTPYLPNSPGDLPADGFDGSVRISDGEYTTPSAVEGYPDVSVDRSRIIFHELSENFLRTEGDQGKGMPYATKLDKDGQMTMGGAHEEAGKMGQEKYGNKDGAKGVFLNYHGNKSTFTPNSDRKKN